MAPTGPGEGGRQAQGVLRMRVGDGRRGSGVQNAGALPCPRAFRPSGRVRSDLSSSVTAPPPGSRGCVRRLGEARRPVAASAWYWVCGVAPLGAFVRAGFSERLVFDSVPGLRGRSTRCVREGELLGAPDVRLGAGERGASLGAGPAVAPLSAIVRGGLLGAPDVRLGAGERGASLGAGPAVAPLGGRL